MRIEVPFPTALSTKMAPLWPRTMPRIADMPSPRPGALVVKKGSKSRC